MSDPSPSADQFRQAYAQQPPWEIGHLQPALAAVADQIQGSVLDAGCGTGDCALHFASQGHAVYGVDFVPETIAHAKAKAESQGLEVCFLTMDALALGQLPRQFDNVIDCGLFHVLSDADRPKYVAALATVSRQELETAFADDWQIESIDDVHMQAASHVPAGVFSPGGPRAYRLVARRIGGLPPG
jgi:2-polyprenyl-3-methyl-5-hydroxy-6-metoxy-1,4-benzoquinol methylase